MGLFKRWRARRAAKKQLKAEQKQKNDKIVEVAEEKQEQVKPVKPKQTVQKKEETNDKFKYHVSQNKDKKSAYFKQWRVRRSGSSKTIKYFDTQKEAIEYAEDLAKRNDTTVVIHKVDGSIRRQNY